MEPTRLRLGELLVDARIITPEQLAEVLEVQKADGRRLGILLVERGLVNETQLTQILSQQLSVPWVSLYHVDFSKRLLSMVPRDVAVKFCLVPIYVRHVRGQGDTLYVAMYDPTNVEALRICAAWSGLPTRAMISSPADIRNAIDVYYGPAPEDEGAAQEQPESSAEPPAVESAPESTEPAQPTEQAEQAGPAGPAEQAEQAEPSGEQSSVAVVDQEPAVEAFRTPPDAGAVEEESAVPPSARAGEEGAASQEVHEPAPGEATGSVPEAAEATGEVRGLVEETTTPSIDALDSGTLGPEAATAAEPYGGEQPTQGAPGATPPGYDDSVSVEVGGEMPFDELLSRRVREPTPGQGEPPAGPAARTKSGRMMALTLLDGTTLALPVKRGAKKARIESLIKTLSQPENAQELSPPQEPLPAPLEQPAPAPRSSRPAPPSPPEEIPPADGTLTGQDVVAALRAAAHGVDPSEILGSNARWETVAAAILSLLLRKGVITDNELAAELKKL